MEQTAGTGNELNNLRCPSYLRDSLEAVRRKRSLDFRIAGTLWSIHDTDLLGFVREQPDRRCHGSSVIGWEEDRHRQGVYIKPLCQCLSSLVVDMWLYKDRLCTAVWFIDRCTKFVLPICFYDWVLLGRQRGQTWEKGLIIAPFSKFVLVTHQDLLIVSV